MMIQTGIVQTESFSMDYFRFGTGSRPLVILPGLSVQSVMGAAQAVEAAFETSFPLPIPSARWPGTPPRPSRRSA